MQQALRTLKPNPKRCTVSFMFVSLDASIRYSYAVKRIPSQQQLQAASGNKFNAVFAQLRIHLLLNLSRCKRKMKDFEAAVNHATEVIKVRLFALGGKIF